MRKIQFRGTKLKASAIALGCMHLGGAWDDSRLTSRLRKRAERAVRTALEMGITLFDHADIYCRGKSEEIFGEILHAQPHLRQGIVIQTKCGIRFKDDPAPGVPARYDSSYRHILDSVDASLRRLRTDHIDILLLHRPDPLIEPEDVALAFRELQESGKVRHFGVSNTSWEQVERLQSALDSGLVVNQLQLSLAHADLIWNGVVFNEKSGGAALETLAPFLQHGIQIQAWGPLAQGRLAAPDDDSPLAPAGKLIRRIARAHAVSRHAIPLAWLLRHPALIQPVIGTTKPRRIRACTQAAQITLSREEWFSLLVAARNQELP